MVENVLAQAVGLEIERHGGGDGALSILDHDMVRHPARAGADRACVLERVQERVGEERVGGRGLWKPDLRHWWRDFPGGDWRT